MARNFLPPGFRFHPTDVELVMYYLKRKILGKKLHFEAIPEINLYKFPPWDLPDKSFLKTKDREWYFFCPTEKKYASGVRMNRATETGYWKTTGRDRPVQYKENVVGRVRTLIFHLGSAPHGKRTDWVIHEYKMEAESLAANEVAMEAYVLCKVFHKNGPGPKNGSQYGALFEEEDWNDDCEIPLYPSLPVGPCPSLPTVEVHKNHKSSAAPGSSMVQASKDALWNGERLSYVSSAVELQKNQNSSGMVDPSHSPVSSMVQASRQDALLNGECLSYVSGAVELQKNQNSSGMVDPSHSPVSSMVQASRQDALLNGECLSYVTGPAELQKNQNFSGMVDLSHSPVSSMVQASRQDALLNGERLSYVTGTAELQKYQNSSAALSMVDLSHSPGSSMVQASREDAFLNGERLSIVTSTVNPANTSGLSSREAYPSLSTHSAQDMILDRDHLDIVHLLASFDADPMHFTRNANNEAHLDSGRETQLVPNSNLNDPFSGLDDLDGLANLNSGGLDFSGTEFVELDDLNAPLNWGSRVGGMLSNGFYSPCNFTGYVLPEITQSTFSVYDPHPRPADLHQLPFGFDSSEILENSTVVPMGQIYQPSYPRDCSNLTPYQPEENRKRKRLLPKSLFCRWSVEQDCSSEHFLNTPTIVGVLCC